LDKVYDNLDFTYAFDAFVNTMQGVNAAAIRKGFLDIGVKDNEVLVFSKLKDAKSLFLTANADTVYIKARYLTQVRFVNGGGRPPYCAIRLWEQWRAAANNGLARSALGRATG
jgi:hypothetical protein